MPSLTVSLALKISIHALREEGDPVIHGNDRKCIKFLSTPSARRATCRFIQTSAFFSISIHALREEGDTLLYALADKEVYFYPRPPRGGRPTGTWGTIVPGRFLSTPSARRATYFTALEPRRYAISIHALREEGDRIW